MFGEDKFEERLADLLLNGLDLTLEEVLELNDLTVTQALEILIREGHIHEPRSAYEQAEGTSAG